MCIDIVKSLGAPTAFFLYLSRTEIIPKPKMENIMSRLTSAIILSVAACAFTAAPSFAQSSYGGGDYRNTTSSVKSKAYKAAKKKAAEDAKAAAKEKAMMEADKMKDGMVDKAAMKDKTMMKDKAMMKDDHMKSDTMAKSHGSATGASASHGSATTAAPSHGSATGAVPSHGSATTSTTSYGSSTGAAVGKPTNCPAGTTAQDNGTCLLTSGSLPGS